MKTRRGRRRRGGVALLAGRRLRRGQAVGPGEVPRPVWVRRPDRGARGRGESGGHGLGPDRVAQESAGRRVEAEIRCRGGKDRKRVVVVKGRGAAKDRGRISGGGGGGRGCAGRDDPG